MITDHKGYVEITREDPKSGGILDFFGAAAIRTKKPRFILHLFNENGTQVGFSGPVYSKDLDEWFQRLMHERDAGVAQAVPPSIDLQAYGKPHVSDADKSVIVPVSYATNDSNDLTLSFRRMSITPTHFVQNPHTQREYRVIATNFLPI